MCTQGHCLGPFVAAQDPIARRVRLSAFKRDDRETPKGRELETNSLEKVPKVNAGI